MQNPGGHYQVLTVFADPAGYVDPAKHNPLQMVEIVDAIR